MTTTMLVLLMMIMIIVVVVIVVVVATTHLFSDVCHSVDFPEHRLSVLGPPG